MGDSPLKLQPIFERYLGKHPQNSLFHYEGPKGRKIKEIGIDLNEDRIVDPQERIDVNQDGKITESDYRSFYDAHKKELMAKRDIDNRFYNLVLEIESRRACLEEAPALSPVLERFYDKNNYYSDESIHFRMSASELFGRSKYSCTIPTLIGALGAYYGNEREAASDALISMGEIAVTGILEYIKGFASSDFSICSPETISLGMLDILIRIGKTALPHLEKALEDSTLRAYHEVICKAIEKINFMGAP